MQYITKLCKSDIYHRGTVISEHILLCNTFTKLCKSDIYHRGTVISEHKVLCSTFSKLWKSDPYHRNSVLSKHYVHYVHILQTLLIRSVQQRCGSI